MKKSSKIIGGLLVVLVLVLVFNLNKISYKQNVSYELEGVQYDVHKQEYLETTKKIIVDGYIEKYLIQQDRNYFYGDIRSENDTYDYKNYTIFYGKLGDSMVEYTVIMTSKENNESYYLYSYYGDLDFKRFILIDYDDGSNNSISHQAKLEDDGNYTLYTSFTDKEDLEYYFNHRYDLDLYR